MLRDTSTPTVVTSSRQRWLPKPLHELSSTVTSSSQTRADPLPSPRLRAVAAKARARARCGGSGSAKGKTVQRSARARGAGDRRWRMRLLSCVHSPPPWRRCSPWWPSALPRHPEPPLPRPPGCTQVAPPCQPLLRHGERTNPPSTGPGEQPGPVHLVTRPLHGPQGWQPVSTGSQPRRVPNWNTKTRTGPRTDSVRRGRVACSLQCA